MGDGELDGVLLTRELRNGAGGGASGQVNMWLALHLAEVSMLDICRCMCSRPWKSTLARGSRWDYTPLPF